eukprot:5680317-Pleurochrysis_carterae.AAC.8
MSTTGLGFGRLTIPLGRHRHVAPIAERPLPERLVAASERRCLHLRGEEEWLRASKLLHLSNDT